MTELEFRSFSETYARILLRGGVSPRQTVAVQDKITLEMIRNVEMAARGRFFIDEEGKAVWKSRYARQ